jgi:hypothetical protein
MFTMMSVLLAVSTPGLAAEEQDEGSVEAEFGKGVTMTAADDSLSMQIRARVQTRASLLLPDPESEEPDPISEIAIRRARVTIQGHALTRDLTYYVQLAFSNQDTESDLRLPLRDAYINYAGLRDLELRVGQGKVPYGRQRITSSGSLQLVDRSIVVAELNLDRDVGLTLHSKDLGGAGGRFGYALGGFGGDGRNRLGESFGYLGVGRVWIRPMGEFDDIVEADLERRDQPKLAIGAGAAYNQSTNRPRSTISEPFEFATFDYLHAGGDAMFKWNGLCLQGELMMRRATEDSASEGNLTEYSRSGYGWYAQVGQMLGPHLELAARYSDLVPFPDTDPEFVRSREVGGGASWYFRGHNLKWQADYFYLPTGDTFEGGNQQIRTQVQLWL